MKNALLITRSELVELVRNNLEANGFNISDASVRISSTGATVVGAVKNEALVGGTIAIVVAVPDEDEDEDDTESFSLNESVLAAIASAPMTIGALSEELQADEHDVRNALQYLGDQVASVAPARRNGATVSCWMKTGTAAFQLFVAAESVRIDKRVEELRGDFLPALPAFYERGRDRMEFINELLDSVCEEDAEAIRRDCRAVFYRMAELDILEHKGHSRRKAKTYSDKINVSSLQRAVREVLIQSDYGMSRQGIAEKLPGFVDDGLLRHAIKRMEDVYEQGGMYCRNS